MQKGSRRLLVVPPSFGYGAKGMGSKVPSDSTLIFDVEVMKVIVTIVSEPVSFLFYNFSKSTEVHGL